MALDELVKNSGLVKQAYELIHKVYGDKKRSSGESYIDHSIATAKLLSEWKLDEATIAAGLLHDVAEHTEFTLEDIEKDFGKEMKFLVDGVTKISSFKYSGGEEQAETIRKMILAMAQDLRVVLIKLAARRDNINRIDRLPQEKQKNLALRTIEVYAPLAYRLGMHRLSGELEDAVFPYVYPEEHKWLIENIKYKYDEQEKFLDEIKPIVEGALQENGIRSTYIDFRAKRYASLYKKLLRYEMDIERVYDLVAFRIIVNELQDCYATLGILHKLWPPIPGRIKDYCPNLTDIKACTPRY